MLLKPWQFSCFNEDDQNRKRMNAWIEYPDAYPPMGTCLTIARLALQGLTIDPTGGATHYHEQSIVPDWADDLMFLTQLGRHKFYV